VRYANYMSSKGQDVAERSLASRLRLAIVRLNRRLRAQRTSSSVTLTQLSALFCLHKCGPLTPGELAAKEVVQPPSMTRVIAALEEQGYVSRRPHPSDGRQAIVEITEEGSALILADISAREAWLDKRLAALSDEEREVLSRASEILDRMAGQQD
jgi:DNA-binding MarR family transcriptional regulator